ncbi:MAG: glycosyltransferase family 4 protein [Patescibacteria group bacterium]
MDKPLVLLIIPTLSIGGAERFAVEMATHLPSHGFDTKLITLFERGPLFDEVRQRNIRWKQLLPSRHASRIDLVRRLSLQIYGQGVGRGAQGVGKIHHAPRPTPHAPLIIHTNLFGPDFWTAVVRSMHAHIRPQPIFISTVQNIDNEDGFIRHAARRWAAHRFDRLIGLSEATAAYAKEDLRVPASRVQYIDGMNFLQSDSRPDVPMHQPVRFVSVGRLVEQKGFDIALRALAKVPPPWHYTIIGSGPLEHELKELSEKLGIAARMEWIPGTLDTGEVLRGSDLMLFPSRWEGLGSVSIEAACIGLPVLTSDIPAIQSVFPASQRIKVGDVSAWTQAMTRFIHDPSKAFAMAKDRAPAIKKRFDPASIAGKYAEVYRKMLKRA